MGSATPAGAEPPEVSAPPAGAVPPEVSAPPARVEPPEVPSSLRDRVAVLIVVVAPLVMLAWLILIIEVLSLLV
jgi:hypothetical protein